MCVFYLLTLDVGTSDIPVWILEAEHSQTQRRFLQHHELPHSCNTELQACAANTGFEIVFIMTAANVRHCRKVNVTTIHAVEAVAAAAAAISPVVCS